MKLRFVVPTDTDEYKSIVTNFDQAMNGKYSKIIQIERIQNERWYMQYLAHVRDFRKRLNKDTEKRLYHGCPEQAAHLIVEDCFNRSFAGVNGKNLKPVFLAIFIFFCVIFRHSIWLRGLLFIKRNLQSRLCYSQCEEGTIHVRIACSCRKHNSRKSVNENSTPRIRFNHRWKPYFCYLS